MNITTLINAIRDVLANSSEISDWSVAIYGHGPTITKGADEKNPPEQADYPVIHLFPIGKSAGYGVDMIGHDIGISCGVSDTSITSSTVGQVTLLEYTGLDNLEAFRKLVETAVVTAVESGLGFGEVEFGEDPFGGETWHGSVFLDDVKITYETIEHFPFFLASMALSINGPATLGGDPFE